MHLLFFISELVLQVVLLFALKQPSEIVSKSHGRNLRQALLIIKDSLYNYGFRSLDYQVRYLLLVFFIPSLAKHIRNCSEARSFIVAIMVVYDALCLVDVVNTTQNWMAYYILLLIRVYRICVNIQDAYCSYLLLPSKSTQPKTVQTRDCTQPITKAQQNLIKQRFDISEPRKDKKKSLVKDRDKAQYPQITIHLKQKNVLTTITLTDPLQFHHHIAQLDHHVSLYLAHSILQKFKKQSNPAFKQYYQQLIAKLVAHILLN